LHFALQTAHVSQPRRVLFVTGQLAEPALRNMLAHLAAPFAYDVAALRITVAALMTTTWIARHLSVGEGTDLVLIPGLCEGDPAVIQDKVGVPVAKGPADLREIPRYFGRAAATEESTPPDIATRTLSFIVSSLRRMTGPCSPAPGTPEPLVQCLRR